MTSDDHFANLQHSRPVLRDVFTLADADNYITNLNQRFAFLKHWLVECSYHMIDFGMVVDFFKTTKNEINVDLINIVVGLMSLDDIRRIAVADEYFRVSDAINKMDDLIDHFIFAYDTMDTPRMNGWQYPERMQAQLRKEFNCIEDLFLFSKISISKWISKNKGADREMTRVIDHYPREHTKDVVSYDRWRKVCVLHKVGSEAEAASLADVYRPLLDIATFKTREAYVFDADDFYHTADGRVPKRQQHPYALRKKLYQWQDGKCACCKDKAPLKEMHLDHVTPLASGGVDKECNLQLLCRECNLTKGDKPMHNVNLYDIVMRKRQSKTQSNIFI